MMDEKRVSAVLLLLLVLAGGWVFMPLWPALLLAMWVAALVMPWQRKLKNRLGGRERAAAVVTALVFLGIVLPLVLMAIPLVFAVVGMVKHLAASGTGRQALETVVAGSGDSVREGLVFDIKNAIPLLREHGAQAWDIIGMVAGSTFDVLVGFFVFMLATHEFLTRGVRLASWFRDRLPIRGNVFDRLGAAFLETGRGLFVGVGLTSLLQGLVATISYVALGIPRALVLGALTTFTSLLPAVGTGMVWLPISVGLFLSGRHGAAVAMFVIGAVIIGSVDNFLRPVFARFGKLRLSSFSTLIAMFGGLTAFGSWGLLLGPLCVRLAVEAMEIWYDESLPTHTVAAGDVSLGEMTAGRH